MNQALQTLIAKINEGEGIERFSRRCERENFKQWFWKFLISLPSISVSDEVTEETPEFVMVQENEFGVPEEVQAEE